MDTSTTFSKNHSRQSSVDTSTPCSKDYYRRFKESSLLAILCSRRNQLGLHLLFAPSGKGPTNIFIFGLRLLHTHYYLHEEPSRLPQIRFKLHHELPTVYRLHKYYKVNLHSNKYWNFNDHHNFSSNAFVETIFTSKLHSAIFIQALTPYCSTT